MPVLLVIASTVRCAAIRFSFLKGRRILSCSALRMTHNLVIANTYGVWLYFRLPVIASTFRCVAIRFFLFKPLHKLKIL